MENREDSFLKTLESLGILEEEVTEVPTNTGDIDSIPEHITAENRIYENKVIDYVEEYCNKVYIAVKNDYFQKLFLDSLIEDIYFKQEYIEINSELDLKKYFYLTKKSIFNENSILKLSINCRLSKPVLAFIGSVRFKTRITIVYVYNQSSVGFLKGYLEDKKIPSSPELIALEDTESYSVKRELIQNALRNMNLKTASKEVFNLLTKVLIARSDDFESLLTSLEVAKINDIVITLEYIEDIAGNVDFYKLDDLFENILRAKSIKKTIKYLNYFLKIKQYSPSWLLTKFREYVIYIDKAYNMKYTGIFKHPVPSNVLEARIKASNRKDLSEFYKISNIEQQNLLDFCVDVPYQYFSEVSKLALSKNYNSSDKEAIYKLILDIYTTSKEYGEDKGFDNQRKLKIMKENAKYRKKKKK